MKFDCYLDVFFRIEAKDKDEAILKARKLLEDKLPQDFICDDELHVEESFDYEACLKEMREEEGE